MKRTLLALALAAACAALAAPLERPQDRWKLADIYSDTPAWDADYAKVEAQLKDLEACRGELGSSSGRFKQCMDTSYGAFKTLLRLYTYASESAAQDTGDAASQALE